MTGPNAGLDGLIAELSEQVAQLYRHRGEDVTHLREAIGLVAEMVPRLGQVETTLAQQVLPVLTELTDQVTALAQRGVRYQQVHWPTLSHAEALEQWPLLADWVDEVLCGWFQLTRAQLPDCWALHRPVVITLSWLRIGYLAAYDKTAIPQLGAEWNSRWRRDALAAITAEISPDWCGPGQHLVAGSGRRTARDTAARRTDPRLDAAALAHKPQYQWTADDHDRLHQVDAELERQRREADPLRQHYQYQPTEEPTRREYWDRFLHTAIERDLVWRAQRDAHEQQKPSPVRPRASP